MNTEIEPVLIIPVEYFDGDLVDLPNKESLICQLWVKFLFPDIVEEKPYQLCIFDSNPKIEAFKIHITNNRWEGCIEVKEKIVRLFYPKLDRYLCKLVPASSEGETSGDFWIILKEN